MVLRVGGAGGAGGVAVSAGTNQASSGTVVFSNSNGITFGQDTNGVITASVAGTVAGGTAIVNFSAGTTSGAVSNIVFSNSNSVSFGLNGSTITASVSQNNQAVSAANGSYSFQTLSFSNANGVSFGTSAGSALTASVAAQTAQTVGIYASSQTTGQSSSSTVDARSLTVVGAGIISAGMSAGSLIISATGGGGAGGVAVSAGTQSVSTGTMVFSNSNNVTFGMSGSSQITASASFSQSNQIASVFAVSNTTQSTSGTIDARSLSFQGAGAVSVGVSNGSVIISAAAGAQSNQSIGVYAVSNTTQSSSGTIDARSMSINAYGMISGGFSNGSIVISGPDTTSFAIQSVGMSTGGNTAGDTGFGTDRLVFAGGANITLSGSTNAGSMTISVVGGAGGGGGVAISAGTQSVSTGTMVYSNSNNITFGMSGSSRITGSYNFNWSAGTTSGNVNSISFSNGSGVSFGLNAGTMTASVAAQTAQTVGLYASSQTTGQSSSSTVDARSISFVGAGNISVGLSAGSYIISGAGAGAAPAASAANGSFTFNTLSFSNLNGVSFGTSAGSAITASVAAQTAQSMGLYALGNTTQNSSTTLDARTLSFNALGAMTMGYSAGSIQVSAPPVSSLVGAGGISLSSNGSTVTISYTQGTRSGFSPYADLQYEMTQNGQGVLILDPEYMPLVQFDRVVVPVYNTNSSNSSGSHTLSFWAGLYSQNASTLSLHGSASASFAITQSGTVGIYSSLSGLRALTFPWTTTISGGQYWLGLVSRTTSGGADGSYSHLRVSAGIATNLAGMFSAATNASVQMTLGQGSYSATTSGMPSSIAFSQLQGTGSQVFRAPVLWLASSTV